MLKARNSRKLCGWLAAFILLAGIAAIVSAAIRRQPEVKRVSLTDRRTSEAVQQEAPIEKKTIYFGFDVRLTPSEDVAIYIPFMKYLSEKTGYLFKIRFTKEYEKTQENLGRGLTQFAALGSVSFIKGNEEYGIISLVRGLNKENKAEYQAAIFTLPGSDIKTLLDIKGKTFAFGSPDSTQGYLIPRKMLEDAGVNLIDLKSYEYTGSHMDAAKAVISGRFAAGGMQDTLAKIMEKEGKIRIIKFSRDYPSSGIAANKDVDRQVLAKVKSALLEFRPQAEHQGLLLDWEKTEMPNGFIEAKEEDYAELKNMLAEYKMSKE